MNPILCTSSPHERCSYMALDTLVKAAAMAVASCLQDLDKVTKLPVPTTLHKEISQFL